MKYFIQGRGEINLTEQDFVAEGGEGKIYTQGSEVFKIYTDVWKMISPAKIQELSALTRDNIIRPQAVLLDKKNTPVGFSMKKVDQAVALPRLFTNDFRNQRHIQAEQIGKLVQQIMDTISFIHHQGFLMVDGNEMNYLVDENTWQTAYFIDVDSYQTPGFPATAIMPSIKDHHSQGFSKLTDWFAFAIIACQLFIGIHPYKGKHPQFKKRDLEARMKANISVFNQKVSLPAAARDFTLIPQTFYDWFVRLFENGERLPPPQMAGGMVLAPVVRKVVQGTNNFTITPLRDFPQEIRRCFAYNGIQTVISGKQVYIAQQAYDLGQAENVIFAPQSLEPLACGVENEKLTVLALKRKQDLDAQIKAAKLLFANDRVYTVNHDNLTEIRITEYAGKILVSPGKTWKIMPHAHQVLDGMVYESVLGRSYLVIPYQTAKGHSACMIQAVPELDGYKILTGKHENGVAMLGAYRDGLYHVLCLRFNRDYNAYHIELHDDTEQAEVNFISLDNGVTVHILQDGGLELSLRDNGHIKRIQDPVIRTDMQLARNGTEVLFFNDNKLYRMKMKQT